MNREQFQADAQNIRELITFLDSTTWQLARQIILDESEGSLTLSPEANVSMEHNALKYAQTIGAKKVVKALESLITTSQKEGSVPPPGWSHLKKEQSSLV